MKTKFLDNGVNPRENILRELNAREIRSLLEELPPPISVWRTPGETYRVYRVKGIHDERWLDDVLYELLLSMRGSYYIYGDRPPLDKYDGKSAIYAAQVTYSTADGIPVEEWFNLRLVPSDGVPIGAGELDVFKYNGRLVSEIVQERLCGSGESYTEVFPGCSRMCGIDPFYLNEEEPSLRRLPSRHAHTTACYAMVSYHMLEDLRKTAARYITAVIIDRFIDSTLTVEVDGNKYPITFTPASEILGPGGSMPTLDRRGRDLYIYKYPGYHLDARKLVEFLAKIIHEGKISPLTLRHYIGEDFSIEDVGREKGMTMVAKLKDVQKLLTVRGNITGSSLTGEELRDLIDKEVPDGPRLKITPLGELEKSVEAILRVLHVIRV